MVRCFRIASSFEGCGYAWKKIGTTGTWLPETLTSNIKINKKWREIEQSWRKTLIWVLRIDGRMDKSALFPMAVGSSPHQLQCVTLPTARHFITNCFTPLMQVRVISGSGINCQSVSVMKMYYSWHDICFLFPIHIKIDFRIDALDNKNKKINLKSHFSWHNSCFIVF